MVEQHGLLGSAFTTHSRLIRFISSTQKTHYKSAYERGPICLGINESDTISSKRAKVLYDHMGHGKRNSKLSTFQIKQLCFKANPTIRHHIWGSLGEIYVLIFDAHNVLCQMCVERWNPKLYYYKIEQNNVTNFEWPLFLRRVNGPLVAVQKTFYSMDYVKL